ncbi:MAG: hypothetical protein JWO25_2235 [Alphaproteobacteria bacterium]|nr:hypothetical protein [Alphaproteobacteria bacterium]
MMRFATTFALACLLAAGTVARAGPERGDQAESAAGPLDRMICKRFIKTGSLVDAYRTCKTKREWERERENVRQFSVSDSCNMRGEKPGMCG